MSGTKTEKVGESRGVSPETFSPEWALIGGCSYGTAHIPAVHAGQVVKATEKTLSYRMDPAGRPIRTDIAYVMRRGLTEAEARVAEESIRRVRDSYASVIRTERQRFEAEIEAICAGRSRRELETPTGAKPKA